MDDTACPLPLPFGRRLFALLVALVVIIADLAAEVIRAREWAPWLRFVGTVVLVVFVVVVLRDAGPHPLR